ncbi:hypothetical protein [Streptomyces sp. MJM1172]|nr:hypothetical protein [Streptomyces sp. MJM1172]
MSSFGSGASRPVISTVTSVGQEAPWQTPTVSVVKLPEASSPSAR